MYIFIDESGDLGFDFAGKPKTSKYFVVTAVVLDNLSDLLSVRSAVKKTIRRKLSRKSGHIGELKSYLASEEMYKK